MAKEPEQIAVRRIHLKLTKKEKEQMKEEVENLKVNQHAALVRNKPDCFEIKVIFITCRTINQARKRCIHVQAGDWH